MEDASSGLNEGRQQAAGVSVGMFCFYFKEKREKCSLGLVDKS